MQFVFVNHTLDIDRRELRRGSEAIAVEPQVNSDEPYQRGAKGVDDIGDKQKLIRTHR